MNVLFIVSDDLRAGGAFGSNEVRTPNIDRLAARGINFERAYSQFPWCAPSRASFLTGLRPNTVRVYDLGTHVRSNVPDVVTMPQYFRQSGYFSARVGKIYHQGVPGDVGKRPSEDLHDDPASWDVAINPSGRDKAAELAGRLINLTPRIPFGGAFAYLPDEGTEEEQTDGIIADNTVELIQANKNKPFFIAAGFYRPHVPEIAPKKYFGMYPQINFRLESPEHIASVLPASRTKVARFASSLSPEQQRTFVQSYYALTSFMDAQVGRLLEGLEKSGVADKTIVVFTSDHGFNLGEHGQWQKQMLWEETTRVPLVIYVPKSKANGRASNRLVELLDLYPTLADLAGLPPPPKVEGRSLRRLLDRPDDPTWNYPALSQVSNGRSVRYETWRYSEWGKNGADGSELYNLASDPGEYRNLAGQPAYASIVSRLKAMLPGDPPPSTGPRIPSVGE